MSEPEKAVQAPVTVVAPEVKAPIAHPPHRMDPKVKSLFEKAHKLADEWNKAKHSGSDDWRPRGEMVDGSEQCFMASATAGANMPESEWNK